MPPAGAHTGRGRTIVTLLRDTSTSSPALMFDQNTRS